MIAQSGTEGALMGKIENCAVLSDGRSALHCFRNDCIER